MANDDLIKKGIYDVTVTCKEVLNVKRSLSLVSAAETYETVREYLELSEITFYFYYFYYEFIGNR